MGAVVRVKVLGSLALIDEGETDHKIIVLREDDLSFDRINSMSDYEREFPGTTARLIDWMKNYKTSDGKPQNKLKEEVVTTPDEAKKIIDEVAGFYSKLVSTPVAERPACAKNYFLPSH